MPYIPARSAFSVAGQHLMGLGNLIAQQAVEDAARKREEERYADAIRREQEGRITDLALRGFVADTPDATQGVMQRGAASGTPIAAVPGMPGVGVGLGALIGGAQARERFQAGPSVKIGDTTLRYDRNADLSALEGDRQFNRQQGAQIGAERRDEARDATRFTRDAAHQERMARLQAALSRVGRSEPQPSYQLQEVEGGFARFNPRTGQLEPIGQGGAPQDPQIAAVVQEARAYAQSQGRSPEETVGTIRNALRTRLQGRLTEDQVRGAAVGAVPVRPRSATPPVTAASARRAESLRNTLDNFGNYEAITRGYLQERPGRGARIGAALGFGADADRGQLQAAQRALMLDVKELAELGVLNGPDLDIIEDLIGNPMALSSARRSPDFTIQQLREARRYIERRAGVPSTVPAEHGRPFSPDNPYAPR